MFSVLLLFFFFFFFLLIIVILYNLVVCTVVVYGQLILKYQCISVQRVWNKVIQYSTMLVLLKLNMD